MSPSPRTVALANRLTTVASSSDPARLVEIGIGTRPEVAAELAAQGYAVTATDVVERTVPDGVRFVRDDVTDPDPAVYADAGLVYALRCPPELHRSLARLAREFDVPVAFTTLGGDPPTVPVTPEQLTGTTLYWIDADAPGLE